LKILPLTANINLITQNMPDNTLILSSDTVWGILLRFSIDLVFITVLIGLIYFRYSKKEKFLFTFFLIGIVVFFVSSIMRRVDIGLGLAFGLFAIFGILRFRTRNFSMKDMSYLFATIGISVINSLGMMVLPLTGILAINVIILIAAFVLEKILGSNMFMKHSIVYDRLDLLKPENQNKLMKDISAKTGRIILRISIQKIDYKREIADLDIYFRE
jgi:hypothetical protein